MATKLPYLNVLEVESVNKEDVSRAIVIDKDEYVKALDIEQITTYQGLSNKPKVNGVELDGDISLDELNVASKEDLNKVISDVEDITSDIPTSENIQDKIDDSLKNYPTKSDVTTEINNSIADKADKSEIPTKVSQLDNDEGFITSIPPEYVTEDELNDIISRLDIQNIPFLIVSTEPYEYSNYNYVGNFTDVFNAIQNNKPYLIYVPGGWMNYKTLANGVQIDNNTIRCVGFLHTGTEHYMSGWVISNNNAQLISNGFVVKNYVTSEELNNKQDKLTPGDNINITDNVISWEAPNVQFVNNIFTDDESLKYTVSDFNGTSTEKEFPVATQESAGLMSVADKTKLDNLDESDGSLPYLKVGLTSIVSGDFDAVYNAIINNEPYFLQVVGSGGEYWGTYINPEGVRASNNTIQCHSEEHTLSGSYDHFNWTITADSVTVVSQYGNAIPYLKVGLNSIVAGDFNAVYSAITNNQPYFLQVTWSGGEVWGYYAIPETIWAKNNTIYCTNLEHKSNGTYNFHSWVITAETVTLTSDINNAIPFLQINNNEIVSGTFAEVYEAVKYDHPYFIKLYITGTTDYWGDPEMTRIDGDNLECWSTYHPVEGSYTQVMWTITPDGTITKREWELNLATQTELNAKQDTLVSGTNIKTINGISILGEGNLVISGSGSGTSNYNDLSNKPSIEGVSLEGALNAHQLNLTEYQEFIPVKTKVDDNIPYYLKCGTSTIISGSFDDVYNAIKNNKNYRIELMLVNVGSTAASYFGQPEVVRIEGDNIVCYASIHFAGEYQRSTWTISSTGVSVTSSSFNLIETETSSSSVPQVEKIITLTQDEYDALSEYDSTVLYLIV